VDNRNWTYPRESGWEKVNEKGAPLGNERGQGLIGSIEHVAEGKKKTEKN